MSRAGWHGMDDTQLSVTLNNEHDAVLERANHRNNFDNSRITI